FRCSCFPITITWRSLSCCYLCAPFKAASTACSRSREAPRMRECAACGGRAATSCYGGLTKCSDCGHVWAALEVVKEKFRRPYDEHFFHVEEFTDYVADRPVLERNFRLRLGPLRSFINPIRHRRLFEIGCAYGFFLNTIRHEFDIADGIDLSHDAVTHA